MPKQSQTPDSSQLKGADGVFETVTVKGVRINKHEYDEEEHGAADEPKKSGGSKSGSRQSSKQEQEDFDSYTVEELKKHLDKEGVEYASDDLKDDLVKKAKKGK